MQLLLQLWMVLFKICRCFGLKICICFWYIPEIQIAAQIVNVQSWVRCGPNSLYSCRGIFCKLCRHFLHLLKMCMLFGHKPRITFCHFFSSCELSHFFASLVYIRGLSYVRNSSFGFQLIFLKICRHFLHGLKVCTWFGHKPQISFCYFSQILNFISFLASIIYILSDCLVYSPHPIGLDQSF